MAMATEAMRAAPTTAVARALQPQVLLPVLRKRRSRLVTRLLDRGVTRDQFETMAAFSPTPVSLETLLHKSETVSKEEGFATVRTELPVRLANIMKEMHVMEAKVFGAHPVFARTLEDYADMFAEVVAFARRPVDDAAAGEFGDVLLGMRQRHFNAVERMAAITSDVVRVRGLSPELDLRMQYFLGRFYMSRIGSKTLSSQYLDVFCNELSAVGPDERLQVGAINRNMDVTYMVDHSFQEARKRCLAVYGVAPDIKITTRNSGSRSNPQVIFNYIASHLEYMIFEVMKNALRAQIDAHRSGARRRLQPIRAEVVREAGFVHITIEDDGTGVKQEKLGRLFKYSYIPPTEKKSEGVPARLGGQGYGVAHSKLYARYLQGDMFFDSVAGSGSCVRVSLRDDPADALECLPVFNTAAQKHYESPEASGAMEWNAPKKPVHELRDERQPSVFR